MFNPKKYHRKYIKKYREQYPWIESLYQARARCNSQRPNVFKHYGRKGIKFLLSKKEIKTLWDRDKASTMIKPSIDRINPDDNYSFYNCRFIEFKENMARAKGKSVICFKNGIFIKKYDRIVDVEKDGFCKVCVSAVIRDKQKTHRNFQWTKGE
jgi:hypothetical protein